MQSSSESEDDEGYEVPPSMHESLRDGLRTGSSSEAEEGVELDNINANNDSQATLHEPAVGEEQQQLLLDKKKRGLEHPGKTRDNARRARSTTASSSNSSGSHQLELKLEQSSLRKRRRRASAKRSKAPHIERVGTCFNLV